MSDSEEEIKEEYIEPDYVKLDADPRNEFCALCYCEDAASKTPDMEKLISESKKEESIKKRFYKCTGFYKVRLEKKIKWRLWKDGIRYTVNSPIWKDKMALKHLMGMHDHDEKKRNIVVADILYNQIMSIFTEITHKKVNGKKEVDRNSSKLLLDHIKEWRKK